MLILLFHFRVQKVLVFNSEKNISLAKFVEIQVHSYVYSNLFEILHKNKFFSPLDFTNKFKFFNFRDAQDFFTCTNRV